MVCPCSEVTIPYGSFLNVTYKLHEICSSDFVSTEWLDFTASVDPSYGNILLDSRWLRDFRLTAIHYFQLLAIYCDTVKETFRRSISSFLETSWINNRLLLKSLFLERVNNIHQTFIESLTGDFLSINEWTTAAIQSNQVLGAVHGDVYFSIDANNKTIRLNNRILLFISFISDDQVFARGICDCRLFPDYCELPLILTFSGANDQLEQVLVPGLRAACTSLYSILGSTINWWYNNTVVQRILSSYSMAVHTTQPPHLTSLNTSAPTRFFNQSETQTKFQTLINEMFIENWTTDLSRFDLFYDRCKPSSCSFTVQSRYTLLAAILILISIMGGVNRALRLLVPPAVNMLFVVRDKFHQRHRSKLLFLISRENIVCLSSSQADTNET